MSLTPQAMPAIEVFYSYSHKDEALRDQLERHLSTVKHLGLIKSWYDRRIEPGVEQQSLLLSDAHYKPFSKSG